MTYTKHSVTLKSSSPCKVPITSLKLHVILMLGFELHSGFGSCHEDIKALRFTKGSEIGAGFVHCTRHVVNDGN